MRSPCRLKSRPSRSCSSVTRKPMIGNKIGALSGAAIKPLAVYMVWEVYRAVQIPIFGMGGVTDFRDVIEKEKELAAVCNGTPDHWHTLVNMRVLKAGKDVYSEKPLTLTIDEGKRLVKVVKETGFATVGELLNHYPRHYVERGRLSHVR